MGDDQSQIGRWTYRPAWGEWLEETFKTKKLVIEHAKAQGWKTIDTGVVVDPDPTTTFGKASDIIRIMLEGVHTDQARRNGGMCDALEYRWLQNISEKDATDLEERFRAMLTVWLKDTDNWPKWRGIAGKGTVYILDDGSVV